MTAVTERPLLRWSSTRDCGRKAIYEATGAPGRERTAKEERQLFRGKRLGRDYAELLSLNHNSRDDHRKFIRARNRTEEKGGGYYGAGKVWCEKKIVWPMGIGHADVWLPATATVVEILSSASASDANVRSKLLQLVGYVEHDVEAENGVLVILNPSDLSEDRIIVSRKSAQYADLVAEMQERVRQVQAWDETGEMPARVCSRPVEARSHFCLFAEHCFEGYVPPTREEIDSPEARELAGRLHQLKQQESQGNAIVSQASRERKEIEAQLAGLVPVGKFAVGPYEVVRTHVERKPSFQWERAELAGMFDPEPYGEFFKPGATYDLWKVERVLSEFVDQALLDSYGDDIPWEADE